MKCSQCKKELKEGRNVIRVQEGIIGNNGFVELDKDLVYCSLDCMMIYFAGSDEDTMMPRRVP